MTLYPDVVSRRQGAAIISGIQDAARLDYEAMALARGSRNMLDTFRNDIQLSGTQLNRAITKPDL
jgi:hypothetical protein